MSTRKISVDLLGPFLTTAGPCRPRPLVPAGPSAHPSSGLCARRQVRPQKGLPPWLISQGKKCCSRMHQFRVHDAFLGRQLSAVLLPTPHLRSKVALGPKPRSTPSCCHSSCWVVSGSSASNCRTLARLVRCQDSSRRSGGGWLLVYPDP